VEGEAMTKSTAEITPRRRRHRILRILAIGAILLAGLIAAAPWIVAKSGLRDNTINAIVASPSVTAASESASFGWFSPLSIDGLDLKSANDHLQVHVNRITTEKSPWQLLASSPDLGTITLDSPHAKLQLPLDVKVERTSRLEPMFKAVVKDGALTVGVPELDEPVIDVRDIDLSLRVEPSDEGRVLTLDPVVLFDRRKLSPQLGSKLLQLFDPTLHDAPQISGEVSLALDKLRIPIGIPRDQQARRMEVEGKLGFHQVTTEVKNPINQALAQVLADLNGRQPHEFIRVVQDCQVRFSVRDGRLFHEGLRLAFPDVDPGLVITSRGSVGLDHTLDLHVDLPRLDKAKRKEKGPASCHITGTIRNPQVAVQDASLVLRAPNRKEPLIDADGINLKMQVKTTDSGPVILVEPVEIFKKEKLNLQLGSGLVKILEPDLASNPRITGEISLSLSRIQIPLGAPQEQLLKRIEAEGKLELHHVTTEVKNPINQTIVQLLADMYGKHASDVVRVVEDAAISFRIRDGRLSYEGLRIGFPGIDPELVVTSRGSIGLDESLDLHLDLPRLDRAKRKAKGPARCHITGTLRNPHIAIQDASFVLRAPDRQVPIIDVDGVNLSMQVKDTESGRVLAVEPVEILKKEKVDLNLASGLVHLIEPDLEGNPRVTGEISLALDKLQVPLGVPRDQMIKRTEVDGKLTLHNVCSQAKNPVRLALLQLLADLHGKQASDVVRVVQDAEIRFQVRDGRMFHEGLRFGLPDIDPELVVTSRGSVGLDGSLDLNLELPRLRKEKREPEGPIQCRITGTLTNPQVILKNASLVVNLTGSAKPALRAANVNLSFGVERTKDGPVLVLAPVTVFNKQKLTTEVSDDLIRLIAPTVDDLTGVQGQFSLTLDKFRLPLGVTKDQLLRRAELVGKLQLHNLSVSARTQFLDRTVKVLADMYGKKPTDVVRIAHNDEIRFQVREGRVYHEGLRIGFPDISPDLFVRSRGWVGLDRSLDIVLELPRIDLKNKTAPGDPKSTAPVRLRITGTVAKPTVTEIKEEQDK
jgi:hypothetical protein